ncbi:hypothetical protein F4860DRAFT_367760 [Xylaria cubensis]|nr:hypothetical protein F4860DRAFT_367760 [Xylaria cubensis]
MEPFAIIGFSFKLPQGTVDDNGLWDVLIHGKNLVTEWPKNRGTLDSLYDNGTRKINKIYARGGHFISEDPGVFDAAFFSTTAKEAAAMDPQHRWAMEAVYHAFENAGMPVERLRGSQTGVVAASIGDDYTFMIGRDPDARPQQSLAGVARSMLPNRISWFFDLRGPSVHIDTACSSSMVALDTACQMMHSGDASAVVILGSNLMLSPDGSLPLSNMNFLSPDSKCFSFDARANGYARGEGVVALVVKPLDTALQHGDTIRAVVRATASNQDGRTPGLTQPSIDAQEALIRRTYAKAGLSFGETRYFEAHGTGTPIGDPIEMKAIGRVFRTFRSPTAPLLVGSIKANIGHLEAASGLVAIVKSILVLERGDIPPQALFENINPKIDVKFLNVQISTQCVPWPTSGLRRVSVNSFGFGGSNSHVVLDDAYHYLRSRKLDGHHQTDVVECWSNYTNKAKHDSPANSLMPRLLVWTAADRNALERVLQLYSHYVHEKVHGDGNKLSELAYTLGARRSIMPWRAFAILDPIQSGNINGEHQNDVKSRPHLTPETLSRASNEDLSAAFVFTGQGAQYPGMGLELVKHYPIFLESLKCSDKALAKLGCEWSIFDELNNAERVHHPRFSQPLCTVLQIALVDLLRSFNISPSVVVGHSSGEIAAAYCVGALSLESACRVAYFRGKVADKLLAMGRDSGNNGAMIVANLTALEVPEWLSRLMPEFDQNDIHIACFNSPTNITLSGPFDAINKLKLLLDQNGIFSQKINTGVAYHSPAMSAVADEYFDYLDMLEASGDVKCLQSPQMISTVTGTVLTSDQLTNPRYWVDNLVSPVLFAECIQNLVKDKPLSALSAHMNSISDFIEIGPQRSLQRPITECVTKKSSPPRYHSVLHRSKPAIKATQELVGMLFCHGYPVSIVRANGQLYGKTPFLVDCPSYPFDHSRWYWAETRLNRSFRFRGESPGYLLGSRALDWNPLQPRWKNWLSIETDPWLGDHAVNGTIVCPGAGLLGMAIEAGKSLATENGLTEVGIIIKDAEILLPVTVGTTIQDATETELQLRPMQRAHDKSRTNYDVQLFSHRNKTAVECFRAHLKVQNEATTGVSIPVDHGLEISQRSIFIRNHTQRAVLACNRVIDSREFYAHSERDGIRYGNSFQLLSNIMWDGHDVSVAYLDVATIMQKLNKANCLIHPAILDASCQLSFVQLSKGLSEPNSTMVLHRISSLWIGPNAWNTVTSSIRLSSTLRKDKNGIFGTVYALTEDGSPLFAFESFEIHPVSRPTDSEETGSRDLLYNITWKPQLSSLSGRKLQKLCSSTTVMVEDVSIAKFRTFDQTMRIAANRALRQLTATDIDRSANYMRKYIASLQQLCRQEALCEKENDEAKFESLLQLCVVLEPEWALLPAVARALPSILRGEIDPLELFFQTDLARRFYTRLYEYHSHDDGLQKFLDLASHENPAMKIFEIGAGTGGMTRIVLNVLRGIEQLTGQTRFVEYVYTDISPSFFEAMKAEFSDYQDRIIFKTFDIVRDASEQAVAVGSYDLVIAGSVLHVTPDLAATLANVRKLLKPNGILLFQEITNPQSLTANAIFGCLEGWWLSTEEWRKDTPLLTVSAWDKLLRETSVFSGVDLVFQDFANKECHHSSIVVTYATGMDTSRVGERGTGDLIQRDKLVLIDPSRPEQLMLALALTADIAGSEIRSLTDFMADRLPISDTALVVSLVEVGQSLLTKIRENDFRALRNLVQSTNNLLWVTSLPASDGSEFDPHSALAVGFLRSLRSEESHKKIVSLVFESGYSSEGQGSYISKVLKSCFVEASCDELEFMVRDGHLVIGRLTRELELDRERVSRVYPQLWNDSWKPDTGSMRPIKLEIAKPGMIDSLRFVEDTAHESDLRADEIEIEAAMWPVSFRDVFVALGRLGDEELGYECAGVVKRIGSAVSADIRPQDRVVMCSIGSMRSHPRAPSDFVIKIPDNLSLQDTVSAMAGLTTAYYSLVNVARLQRGEKILIHSAAGSTGQMAVQIAQNLGAEIFVTVGSDEKKQLIMTNFGIPEDHIFYSRDSSFTLGVKRVAGSVDVLLNSLSGTGLQASWECIAPYGRFIELGKVDIIANSSLPMAQFAKNVAFAAVDLHHVASSNPRLHRSLVESAINLLASGQVQPPTPLHRYPVSEAEKAFRYIQSGQNTGRTIITLNPKDIVQKFTTMRKEWKFNQNASYMIAGGLGGIGRAVVRWMANRGARSFVLPSRSGASTKAAVDLISELTDREIQVLAPCCDLSSADELSTLLESCVDIPPIKGCINAAMALQNSVFETMTHAQWTCTVQSKVQASWNLHHLLPSDMDFFILLSSVAGIYGPVAQSNYTAGCAFQDSLARWRTAAGFPKSVSLDLGWMRTIGIIAETKDPRRHQAYLDGFPPIEVVDFFAILEHYLDPEIPQLDEAHSQLLIGAIHPAHFLARGEVPIRLVSRPLFAGFSFRSTRQKECGTDSDAQEDVEMLFAQAKSKEDRLAIVISAFKKKLARALWIEVEEIDTRRGLSNYGVDSLMAVELRSWIRRDFYAAVTVFEIMGGTNIAAIAELVVERTEAQMK